MRLLITLLCLTLTGLAQARMKVELPDIPKSQQIPRTYVYNGFGCTGANISPQVKFEGVPKKAKSLALTLYDPDAPTGSGWWHWVVYNLPADTTGLPRNITAKDLPKGAAMGKTDFLTAGYGGPCPPAGDKPHHYIFTLYALDVKNLEVPDDASAAMIGYSLNQHVIEKAKTVRLYGR